MTAHFYPPTGQFLYSEHLVPAGGAKGASITQDLGGTYYDMYSGDLVLANMLVPKLGKTVFPEASLDLNFARNKSLVDDVSGNNLITFSRASQATYADSQGVIRTALNNEPRFDHNPTTGESLGLLVEEAGANRALYSQDFSNAAWSKSNTTILSSNNIAPDNTATASALNIAATASSIISQSIVGPNSFYTFSVWAKNIPGEQNYFDLILAVAGNTVQTGKTALTDSWQRYTITSAVAGIDVAFGINNPPDDYAARGIFWGAQLEAGTFPTSYIPTTSATATRATDVVSIDGTNFSSWYRQDEGTVFADAVSPPSNDTTSHRLYALSDGTINNRIICYRNGASSSAELLVSQAGVAQASFSEANWPSSTALRTGIALKENTSIGSLGGSIEAEDTSCLIPTVDRLYIGNVETGAGSPAWNSTIKRLTYWPRRLDNNTLQIITQ